jgi:hypothetical protein
LPDFAEQLKKEDFKNVDIINPSGEPIWLGGEGWRVSARE